MSWRVYGTGLALLLLAGAFLLTDALLWQPGVTERNLLRVRVGMTVEKVEALFGAQGTAVESERDLVIWFWGGQRGNAWVSVEAGRVVGVEWWVPGQLRPRFVVK